MADIKTWTGERLETFIQNENTNEHLHRYAMCLELVGGKIVLDIACGDGYGSNLLSGFAAEVTGVDIDVDTVTNAAAKYQKTNLKFLEGRADVIPCADGYFDVVVSFETIEHHDKHDEMMLEIRRVLKPGGLLVISSPDKLNYSDKPGYKNPFHVKELYAAEFESLLGIYFKNTFFLKQKSFVGSVMIPETDKTKNDQITMYQGSYDEVKSVGLDAVYIVGIASDNKLPVLRATFFDGNAVLKQQFEAFREYVAETVKAEQKLLLEEAIVYVTGQIKGSRTYKLGNTLISPFKAIKKLLHGS